MAYTPNSVTGPITSVSANLASFGNLTGNLLSDSGLSTAAVSTRVNEIVSVRDPAFGAIGNGVHDDTLAFQTALNYCEANQIQLYVPSGHYYLATWVTRNSSFIVMKGDSLETTLITGPTLFGVHFATMTSGILDVEGINFERFDQVFYSQVKVDKVTIRKSRAQYNRSNFYRAADITDNPLSETTSVIITENEIYHNGGFQFAGAVESGIAIGNRLNEVWRDTAVWGTSSTLYQTLGINFGDTDNNNSSISQSLVGGIVVVGNTIDGMMNLTPNGQFNTTNGICITAISSSIICNTIRNLSPNDTTNGEGIYCKAKNIVIEGNTLVDATSDGSTAIAIKGVINDYGPMGKQCRVNGNVITALSQANKYGITTFYGGDVDISNNTITGIEMSSIVLFGYPDRVTIKDNHIFDNVGLVAIRTDVGEATDIIIEGNTIDGVGAALTSGDLVPIRVNAVMGYLKEITNLVGGSGYTSVPTVLINGVSGKAQATILGGAIIGVNINDYSYTTFASPPPITFTGGGGSGASASVTLSTGAINNMKVAGNKINFSPKAGLTKVVAIEMVASSTDTLSSGGIVIEDNEVIADALTTFTGSIRGFNIFSATSGYCRDVNVSRFRMTGPDITKLVPANFNGTSAIYQQAGNYVTYSVNGTTVNGRPCRILSSAQVSDTRATFVVALTGKSVGSVLLGYIPNSVLVTRAMIYTNVAPTSGTSTGKIAFSLGASGAKQILNDTLVTAFTVNTFTACIPDGSAANAKRAVASAGLVALYADITVEALTGGVLTLILETEAIA